MVQRWNLLLERSADCDLYIFPIARDTTYDTARAEIVHLLMPTTSRWKSVEIASTSISVLAPLATCSFERLSGFTWRCGPQDSDSNVRWLPWGRIREYHCDIQGIQYLRNITTVRRPALNLTLHEDMTPIRPLRLRGSKPKKRAMKENVWVAQADVNEFLFENVVELILYLFSQASRSISRSITFVPLLLCRHANVQTFIAYLVH